MQRNSNYSASAYTNTRNPTRRGRGNVEQMSLFQEQPNRTVFRKNVNLLNEGMNEQKIFYFASWGAPLTTGTHNLYRTVDRRPTATNVLKKCNKLKIQARLTFLQPTKEQLWTCIYCTREGKTENNLTLRVTTSVTSFKSSLVLCTVHPGMRAWRHCFYAHVRNLCSRVTF